MNLFSSLSQSKETPYNWNFVVCDSSNIVIIGSNLRYKGFSSALSPRICQLLNLIDLESTKDLTKSIGRLSKLEYLNVSIPS